MPKEIATPPFVVWSLGYACPYREEANPSEPEQVERVLRPLRTAAEALAEQRCLDGICVELDWCEGAPPHETLGFQLRDTLIPFGGEQAAQRTCGDCPANVAMSPTRSPRWAGCHGLLAVWQMEELERRLSVALAGLESELGVECPLPAAARTWARLWLSSPLAQSHLSWHARLWERLGTDSTVSGAEAFCRGLAASHTSRLSLYVRAVPAGIRSGRYWHLPAHCPQCSMLREERSPNCAICHTSNRAEPARRRLAKGKRPYWELARFLGQQPAMEFLQRYASYRAGVVSTPKDG